MELDRDTLISWLEEKDATRLEHLYSGAYRTKVSTVGDKVYLRGLVEISNICRKNCLYCGIRRDNHAAGRYEISSEEVLQSAEFAYKEGYASLVIQGGERTDRAFINGAGRSVLLCRWENSLWKCTGNGSGPELTGICCA